MSMYFITERNSETGKKFQQVERKSEECFNAQKQLANKYKFHSWREGYWVVYGGMSSCLNFDETPDSKIWGKGFGNGEYFPKKNSKIGKEINKEIEQLPKVTIDELNQCVGFNGAPFKTIGFSAKNDKFFGFSVGENWDFIPPTDCKEITTSEYRELFKVARSS